MINNLNIVDKLINESFTPLSNKLLILGKNNFYSVLFDNQEQDDVYFVENIKKRFYDFNLIIGEDSDSIDYKIIIKNPVIKTNYKKIFVDNIFGTKKVEREVTVSYDLDLIDKKNSSLVYNQSFKKKLKDSFDLDKLTLVEDKRYLFTQSALPEESTVNYLLYPAIIISASALAIILFFIIRSN